MGHKARKKLKITVIAQLAGAIVGRREAAQNRRKGAPFAILQCVPKNIKNIQTDRPRPIHQRIFVKIHARTANGNQCAVGRNNPKIIRHAQKNTAIYCKNYRFIMRVNHGKTAAGPSMAFLVCGACEPKSTPETALKNRAFSLRKQAKIQQKYGRNRGKTHVKLMQKWCDFSVYFFMGP